MIDKRFKDPKGSPLINPIEWFSEFGDFAKIFEGVKGAVIINSTEVANDMLEPRKASFTLQADGTVKVTHVNCYDIATGIILTKFMLFAAVKFKNDSNAAAHYVAFHFMSHEIPYFRVGCDYFKIIKKPNRFGGRDTILKQWKKDELKQDHSKEILQLIHKYDDFIIKPNNKSFEPVIDGCYNLYSKFSHRPTDEAVTLKDIPSSTILMNHIFGEQVMLGFNYMKVLYENPEQMLPILSLVSLERNTGKTTFLNWINMIFSENCILINPDDLSSSHNSGYATKNIIMLDETLIEKSAAVEKLKSLATAKTVSVNPKFVQQYSVPFFGKIIMSTNKVNDFMRIDTEEIRFLVRNIKTIPEENHNINIEQDLFNEIPKFLKYLEQLPAIDFSKSRMVFTKEEVHTAALDAVKEESRSWLYKELELMIQEYFDTTGYKEFKATAKDIKDRWFNHNHNASIAYLAKVIKMEMKIQPAKLTRYYPFGEISPVANKPGRPFIFTNKSSDKINDNEQELPF